MTTSFSISTTVAEVVRELYGLHGKQVPFAVALALTRTAQHAGKVEEEALQRSFDNPTPFTLRAVGVQRADKQNLEATVYVKERQASYLRPEIEGGPRDLKTFEEMFAGGYVVPGAGVRRNQYGNVAKATIKRIGSELRQGASKRYFRGVPKGHDLPGGIYQRIGQNRRDGGAIRPLLVFARPPVYEERFPFGEIAKQAGRDSFEREMAVAWAKAIASAR